MAARPSKKREQEQVPGGVVGGISRFIVSLTWAILLAVVIAVVYLAMQFYG